MQVGSVKASRVSYHQDWVPILQPWALANLAHDRPWG